MLGKPIIAQVEDAMIDTIKTANGLGWSNAISQPLSISRR